MTWRRSLSNCGGTCLLAMLDQQWDLLRILGRRLPSASQIERIRIRRLRSLLNEAYRNVPYYHELFREAGLVPKDIRNVADLRYLPSTGRDQIRSVGRDAISRKADPAKLNVMHSSGSGGRPHTTYRSVTDHRLRRAVELRSMVAAGIRCNDRIVTIGPVLGSHSTTRGKLGFYHTTIISTMLPVEQQIDELSRLQPEVFWVYPTILRSLLNEVGKLGDIIRPRMVVTSAEPMDAVLRRRLESELGTEVRNLYGSVECGRISFECAAGEGLHINSDCTILEFEDEPEVSGAGRLAVITNLNSHISPYIRYRLGDRCELVPTPCSCGSPLPLMKPPVGRDWDVIRLPSGRLVAPWGCGSILRMVEGLLHFRLIQKKPDLLLLQMCFANPPAPGILEGIRDRMLEHIGEKLTIRFELRDRLESDTLKFRAFISELEDQY